MGQPKRRATKQGMGAVRPASRVMDKPDEPADGDAHADGNAHADARAHDGRVVVCPQPLRESVDRDPRPLGTRDTVPALWDVMQPTGVRRRATLGLGPADLRRETLPPPRSSPERAPPSAPDRPPTSSPSSRNRTDDPSPTAGSNRASRPDREPIAVDEVLTPRSHGRGRGPVTVRPRIVNAARIPNAPLDSRDAFVLQLVDGNTPVQDIVDASGMPAEDVAAILARLVRLGIVTM